MNFELQMMLAALVVFLFGTGMFFLGFNVSKKRNKIKKEGIETTAYIVGYTPVIGGNDQRYSVAVDYKTAEGKGVRSTMDTYVNYFFRRRHPEGSSMLIKYLPNDPKKFISKKGGVTLSIGGIIMVVTGIGLWALCIFMLCTAFTK